MNSQDLIEELKSLKAYKKDRVRLGKAAVEYNLLPKLISLCHPDNDVSPQASWCLEQSFLLHEESCYPHLKEICELYELPLNSSAKRALCKISGILTKKYYGNNASPIKDLLDRKMRESMLEGCFHELITTNKTANMAFSVYSLFELGKEFDWIYPELIPILQQKLDEEYGNGFKSSARKILAKLET